MKRHFISVDARPSSLFLEDSFPLLDLPDSIYEKIQEVKAMMEWQINSYFMGKTINEQTRIEIEELFQERLNEVLKDESIPVESFTINFSINDGE